MLEDAAAIPSSNSTLTTKSSFNNNSIPNNITGSVINNQIKNDQINNKFNSSISIPINQLDRDERNRYSTSPPILVNSIINGNNNNNNIQDNLNHDNYTNPISAILTPDQILDYSSFNHNLPPFIPQIHQSNQIQNYLPSSTINNLTTALIQQQQQQLSQQQQPFPTSPYSNSNQYEYDNNSIPYSPQSPYQSFSPFSPQLGFGGMLPTMMGMGIQGIGSQAGSPTIGFSPGGAFPIVGQMGGTIATEPAVSSSLSLMILLIDSTASPFLQLFRMFSRADF
jgi:hypothetical protein